MAAILSVQKINKSFGGLKVADDVSFDLEEGEALGVIGPNGAGKSTLFNLIGGTLPVSSGLILFRDREITALPASERCRLGIARSFQVPHPFVGLSVYENLLVASSFGNPEAHDAESACRDILALTDLLTKANASAGSLTLLERKRLELARALASGPRLLLLDEIAGGLTDAECGALIATINTIRERGISIIWIEHVVHALTAVVGRLIVIDFGRIVAEGDPESVMNDPLVREIYMGIEVDDSAA